MPESFHPSGIPLYLKAALIAIILSGLLLYAREVVEFDPTELIIGLWVVAFIISIATKIAHRFKTLEIDDHNITLKIGILSTKTVVVPFERITNVNVHQSLFQRLVGLGTLSVDTAAGTVLAEIKIENMPYKAL